MGDRKAESGNGEIGNRKSEWKWVYYGGEISVSAYGDANSRTRMGNKAIPCSKQGHVGNFKS